MKFKKKYFNVCFILFFFIKICSCHVNFSNITNFSAKKKKNKRKKKPFFKPRPPLPTVDPAATLQGLRTIANLIQIHQQFTLTGHQPLMSGPRFKKPMFSGHNMPGFSKSGQQSTSQFSGSTSTSIDNNITTSDTNENVAQDGDPFYVQKSDEVQKNQNLQSQSLNISPKPPISISDSQTGNDSRNLVNTDQIFVNDQVQRVQSKNNQQLFKSKNMSNIPPKKNEFDDNKFDDFEIYNSPSFINFETTDVVELNDDNLNINPSFDNNITQNDKE